MGLWLFWTGKLKDISTKETKIDDNNTIIYGAIILQIFVIFSDYLKFSQIFLETQIFISDQLLE